MDILLYVLLRLIILLLTEWHLLSYSLSPKDVAKAWSPVDIFDIIDCELSSGELCSNCVSFSISKSLFTATTSSIQPVFGSRSIGFSQWKFSLLEFQSSIVLHHLFVLTDTKSSLRHDTCRRVRAEHLLCALQQSLWYENIRQCRAL